MSLSSSSHSDYLAVLSRQQSLLKNKKQNMTSSELTANRQYVALQTTFTLNEDLELNQIVYRYDTPLPVQDLATLHPSSYPLPRPMFTAGYKKH